MWVPHRPDQRRHPLRGAYAQALVKEMNVGPILTQGLAVVALGLVGADHQPVGALAQRIGSHGGEPCLDSLDHAALLDQAVPDGLEGVQPHSAG